MVKNIAGSSLSAIPPQHTRCHDGYVTEHKRIETMHLGSLCLSVAAVAELPPLQYATTGDSKCTGAEQ